MKIIYVYFYIHTLYIFILKFIIYKYKNFFYEINISENGASFFIRASRLEVIIFFFLFGVFRRDFFFGHFNSGRKTLFSAECNFRVIIFRVGVNFRVFECLHNFLILCFFFFKFIFKKLDHFLIILIIFSLIIGRGF
jgi:hypothetical protein